MDGQHLLDLGDSTDRMNLKNNSSRLENSFGNSIQFTYLDYYDRYMLVYCTQMCPDAKNSMAHMVVVVVAQQHKLANVAPLLCKRDMA